MAAKIFYISNNAEFSYSLKQPEINLWAAAIDRCIEDIWFYANGDYYSESFYNETKFYNEAVDAFNWIHAEHGVHKMCSFPWVCSVVFPGCYGHVIDYYRKETADVVLKKPAVPEGHLLKNGKHGLIPHLNVQCAPIREAFSDDRVYLRSVCIVDVIVSKEPCSSLEEVLERCNRLYDHTQHIPSCLPSILQPG